MFRYLLLVLFGVHGPVDIKRCKNVKYWKSLSKAKASRNLELTGLTPRKSYLLLSSCQQPWTPSKSVKSLFLCQWCDAHANIKKRRENNSSFKVQ